jgi:hypothetical protein
MILTRRAPVLFATLAALLALACAEAAFADGNVVVKPVGRRGLVVVGDGGDNDVVIERSADDAKTLVIRGRSGTTINGRAEILVPRPRKLEVSLGEGDDVVAVANVRVTRKLVIDLGPGNDRCELISCALRGRTKVIGGPGDDELTAVAGTRFGRSLRVSMDEGADVIDLQDGTIDGRTKLYTGDGDDQVSILRHGVTHGAPVVVRTGRDDDTVHIQGCTFQNGVRVLTLEGTDSVTVMKTHFEKGLFLDTGEDDDAAHLEDSSLDGPFKMIGGISTFSGGATLIIINVSFGVTSDGDDKFFWAFVVINRF